MSEPIAITSLLRRHAELMDAGDPDGVAGLLAHAAIEAGDGAVRHGSAGMPAMWRANVKRPPCGTQRIGHVITDPVVGFTANGARATCRSYHIALQPAPGLPLQAIGAGRHHDAFEKVDGAWRFAERDYGLFDPHGDPGEHLLLTIAA